MPDPLKGLKPGTVLLHRSGGAFVVGPRKEDHSGWWAEGRSGLSDRALESGDWKVLDAETARGVWMSLDACGPTYDIQPGTEATP